MVALSVPESMLTKGGHVLDEYILAPLRGLQQGAIRLDGLGNGGSGAAQSDKQRYQVFFLHGFLVGLPIEARAGR